MTNFLICARGGSKGLNRKNIKNFFGKTLVEHAIKIGKEFKESKITLSSDDRKILNIGKKNKINILKRPKKLSKDNSNELDVWRHYLNSMSIKNKKPKFFISLPPTSPLRTADTVKRAINKYSSGNYDFVVAIYKSKKNPYFNMVRKKKNLIVPFYKKLNLTRRQQAPDAFDLTTIVYVVNSNFVKNKNIKSIFQGKVGFVESYNFREVIDIDDADDFETAKLFYERNT